MLNFKLTPIVENDRGDDDTGNLLGSWRHGIDTLCGRARNGRPMLSRASSQNYPPGLAAFRSGVCESGYVEGQNVKIEYVFTNEQYDRLPELVVSLARCAVNVIAAVATPASAVMALKSANTLGFCR